MENQNTIPQPARDYLARLVDARKRAYAASCLACWQQGQPFAAEWPNLKAEYVQDVAAKMRRYLGVKSVQRAPQSAVAEQTTKPETAKPARRSAGKGVTPEVATYDEYCAARGVDSFAPSEPSAHKFPNGVSGAAHRRILARIHAEGEAWQADRIRLRKEYDAKLASGEVRKPTRRESLERTAAGHPDNESVQAARRLLAKMRVPASKPDVEQPAKAVALPFKVVQFKVRKLTKYGRSQDAIEATLTGGNQYYAGLITETIGGMPWADAMTMYQSFEWQERNRAALTQARAYGLLAERTSTYTEAAG